jgi:peptidoglycan/LPS O-acetylase OafA/YrhL
MGRARRYAPALDGLRALAVLAVLLFHGGVAAARGGFLGVDAFFVLSGYLITSLLLAEHARTGRIALGAFWGRRARRLLPALLVLVVAVAAAGRATLGPEDLGTLRGDAAAALLYVANWRMIAHGTGYFDATATPSLLQHTWSLGIEEQFYLLWPLALVAVLHGRRRPLPALCLAGIAASAVTAAVLAAPGRDVGRAYYGTDTRAASLLTGALLAAAVARRPVHARPSRVTRAVVGGLALLGAAYTAWAWTHATGASPWLYRGGLAVGAAAVAAVLAEVELCPAGPAARLLSVRPLPQVGAVSYGLYLWHWPVFGVLDAGRTGLRGPALLTARLTVTLVVALLSYGLVEQPVRRGRVGRAPVLRGRSAILVSGLALVATASLAGALTVPPRVPVAAQAVRIPPAGDHAQRRAHHRVPVVGLFGDSVAWTFARYLPPHPGLAVRNHTALGCGLARGGPFRYFGAVREQPHRCEHRPAEWARAVATDDPDVAVLLVGRWETMDRVHGGRWTHLGDPAYDAYLTGELERAVTTLSARGARVVLCTYPYTRRGERQDGSLYPEDDPARIRRWNDLVRAVAARRPRVVVVADVNAILGPDGRYTRTVDGVTVRSDGLHLTPAGSALLAQRLLPRVAALSPAGGPPRRRGPAAVTGRPARGSRPRRGPVRAPRTRPPGRGGTAGGTRPAPPRRRRTGTPARG